MDYENMTAKEFREEGASRRESFYELTMYVVSIKS